MILKISKYIKIVLISVATLLMLCYPIYTNVYDGLAHSQYERHKAWMNKKSKWYNPVQYRALSFMISEGIYMIYKSCPLKIFPSDKWSKTIAFRHPSHKNHNKPIKYLINNKEAVDYLIVFILFRFIQHALIFYLFYLYAKLFINSKLLIFFGFAILSFSFGNSVADSDFSFYNYCDIIFYLSTILILLYDKNIILLIPIVALASLNRETSALIPVCFILFRWCKNGYKFIIKDWLYFFLLCLFWLGTYLGIRYYFGFVEATHSIFNKWFRLNFYGYDDYQRNFFRAYFEVFGTLSIFPFITLIFFNKIHPYLKVFFFAVVPAWFVIHFVLVPVWESRLLLVPMLIVFLPASLEILEKSIFNFQKLKT